MGWGTIAASPMGAVGLMAANAANRDDDVNGANFHNAAGADAKVCGQYSTAS